MRSTKRNLSSRVNPVMAFSLMMLVAAASQSLLAEPNSAADFKAKCAGCHGTNGGGDTVMGKKFTVRDLRSAVVQKQSDEDIQEIITKGKGHMPAFGKTLDGATIHSMVAYIRGIAQK